MQHFVSAKFLFVLKHYDIANASIISLLVQDILFSFSSFYCDNEDIKSLLMFCLYYCIGFSTKLLLNLRVFV